MQTSLIPAPTKQKPLTKAKLLEMGPPTTEEVEAARELLTTSEGHLHSARSFAMLRIKSVAAFGQRLNEFKARVPRGTWSKWADEAFPGISFVLRCRYAKFGQRMSGPSPPNLKDAGSLTTAMMRTGCIPPKAQRNHVKKLTVDALLYRVRQMGKRVELTKFDRMDNAKKAEFKKALAPLAALHARL